MKGEHLTDLYIDLLNQSPDRALLHYKKNGSYLPISRVQFRDYVFSFSLALQDYGVSRGDQVAILSNNCPEWAISDMAILTLGSIVVPIYPTLTAKETLHILKDSKSKWVVVENDDQLKKIESIWSDLPELKGVSVIKKGSVEFENAYSFHDMLVQGEAQSESKRNTLETSRSQLKSSDLASIIYTSGTTGPPKGVCLTHENFLSNLEGIRNVVKIDSTDSVLSFLPLSHVFERTAGHFLMFQSGAEIYYAESIETVGNDLGLVSPTLLISVPRIYEKIQARIYQQLSGFKKTLFGWAISVGLRCLNTDKPSFSLRLQRRLADRLVFQKIRDRVGGRLRFAVSGGAALGKSLGEFFQAVGIFILEGYGLTETSPVICCNQLEKFKMGSVGLPLPNLEIKLESDGELCVKGPSIMSRYYNLADKTAEVLKDGWFHTGDIAEIDSSGFVSIVDRKKDVIVLSNGKNVAPQPIEKELMTSRYISQAILIGEKRKFVSGLIVPDWDMLLRLAEKNGWGQDKDVLCRHSAVLNYYTEIVNRKMTTRSRYEQVKVFRLLPDEFSLETGYLTPSLKPKRPIIRKDFETVINSMYR